MKCFLSFLIGFAVAASAFSETVVIPAARTVSSIPLLALDGQTIEGLTLSVPLFDDHPLALAELLGGRSQALLTGSTLALKNHLSGGPLVHVVTPVWDVAGLVTLNPNLKSFDDFAGKSLVVPLAGGPLDVQVQAILKARGLTGKVKIDYAEPPQAAALLLQKRVDGACLPEPLVSRLVIQNHATEVTTFADAWADLNRGDGRAPQVSLVTKKDWAQAHGPFLRALVRALGESVASVKANPHGFAVKFAPVLGLPAPVLDRGLSQTLFSVPSAGETADLYSRYLTLTGESRPLGPEFFTIY